MMDSKFQKMFPNRVVHLPGQWDEELKTGLEADLSMEPTEGILPV